MPIFPEAGPAARGNNRSVNMEKNWNVLVLNLGSTSSKVAFFQGDKCVKKLEQNHDMKDLRALKTTDAVLDFYGKIIFGFIDSLDVPMEQMDAIAVRGSGKWGGYKHGAYLLTPEMGEEMARTSKAGHKGLFSSTVIGARLSGKYHIPAYLYDVVPVDELPLIATINGIAGYRRRGGSHTLNCRAVAIKTAKDMGKDFDHSTWIISHLGGGFTTCIIKDNQIIESYNAEEGAFTPERLGRVPGSFMTQLYTDPNMTPQEIDRILRVDVGLYGHLGTSSGVEIEKRIAAGDRKAEIVYQAMAYQISKDIGALGAVACGKVDAIILTGGLAHSDLLTGWITERVGFLAPVVRVPGGMEMEALAGGVARVLAGEEAVNDYDEVGTKRPFQELEV